MWYLLLADAQSNYKNLFFGHFFLGVYLDRRRLIKNCNRSILYFASSYTVLRTQQLSLSQALALQKLEVTSNYDFWKSARPNGNADIMVHKDSMNRLTEFLQDRKIRFSVMVEDVEE